MKNINYALVEEKRPPMYTAMKYWGKKPHNIWGAYIDNYAQNGQVILDPFAGSGVAAFEAVKCGKKAVAFDINPLTSFLIDVYSTDYDDELFKIEVKKLISTVKKKKAYISQFKCKCKHCGNEEASIQHFKWNDNSIYEMGIVCDKCNRKYIDKDVTGENEKKQYVRINKWIPNEKFKDTPSISKGFIKNIGGNNYKNIWTNRNLYVLSEIFDLILSQTNETIKKQLLFGFIQSVHLCSKMCVPRSESSNRAFSTSWGRSAYICSKKQMEMNPVFVFENNCIGKQSVRSALHSIKDYIGKVPRSINVNENGINKKNIRDYLDNYDIVYGIVDIKEIDEIVPKNSIDFIITDPPYGGLVQYVDLSYIWLIWLKEYKKLYNPIFDKEITVKKGVKTVGDFSTDIAIGIRKIKGLIKKESKIVFTFHNKELSVWNAFLKAISNAGLYVEKVIHQQNKRTGESNVSDPYGTSASDFYIRCIKSNNNVKKKIDPSDYEKLIIKKAKRIIKNRNEATPYQILFNGLLSELSTTGFEIDNYDGTLKKVLEKHIGVDFCLKKTDEKYGDLWWINNYKAKDDVLPLSKRVENTVRDLLKKNKELKKDDIFATVFKEFPNGLTPDIRSIDAYIRKYSYKLGERWIYNG